MKKWIFLLFVCLSCSMQDKKSEVNLNIVHQLIAQGQLTEADLLIDKMSVLKDCTPAQNIILIRCKDQIPRIRRDFCLSSKQVIKQLSRYFPDSLDQRMSVWEKEGVLECRLLDGEKRYFRNSVSNLFRLDANAAKVKEIKSCAHNNILKTFCLKHTQQVVEHSTGEGEVTGYTPMTLNYSITLKADAVPEGETVRCWMPYPRSGHNRQRGIGLVETDPLEHIIASNNHLQRSVYMEKIAHKGQPVVFRMRLQIQCAAQRYDLCKIKEKSDDKIDSVVLKQTQERPPHILFTPQISSLADSICGAETNRIRQVQKIYQWIDDNITWASALEYSIMPQIPSYVLKNRHGDCGMQTLLFMSLARSRGIPVKWQSGWMLHPGKVNLHDWCEVYYPGYGWIPLDQSFGLQYSSIEQVHNYYMTGIDGYRMIVNDDFSQPFFPSKIWPRSEPLDFQRGELEWKGGNLYFDKWNYHMDVSYQPHSKVVKKGPDLIKG